MATSKIQTGLRLEESTLAKITAIARLERRSLNAQVEIAIEKLIQQYEESHGQIEVQSDR
jgi:hypothetical protein